MPSTTIHIPTDLLEAVDARARAEGISRNRFIMLAISRSLEGDGWSSRFLSQLRKPLSAADRDALEHTLADVQRLRTRKAAPDL